MHLSRYRLGWVWTPDSSFIRHRAEQMPESKSADTLSTPLSCLSTAYCMVLTRPFVLTTPKALLDCLAASLPLSANNCTLNSSLEHLHLRIHGQSRDYTISPKDPATPHPETSPIFPRNAVTQISPRPPVACCSPPKSCSGSTLLVLQPKKNSQQCRSPRLARAPPTSPVTRSLLGVVVRVVPTTTHASVSSRRPRTSTPRPSTVW